MRQDRDGIGGAALVVGLFAICCGGPLLLAALAATGVGAWLFASGAPVLAVLALLVTASAGALWMRQRGWHLERAEDPDCCVHSTPSAKEGTR